ncbi:MAG: class I SAM-dependent methyltransferase [Steroidobacteraceae bacterium]
MVDQRSPIHDEAVYQYLLEVSSREPEVLARLRAATAPRPEAEMQIGPDQGQLLALLVKLIGARRCIEIGTYTGYSALAVALALPPGGELFACDVSRKFTDVGEPFWREAGVADRIHLKIQPALQTLEELAAADQGRRTFDFAFVDADKVSYVAYYEKLLTLVRPGGLIAIDNTLGLSRTPVIRLQNANAEAIKTFNRHVHRDDRVDLAMLPVGEGLTLLRVVR